MEVWVVAVALLIYSISLEWVAWVVAGEPLERDAVKMLFTSTSKNCVVVFVVFENS